MNATEDTFFESFHCVTAPNVNNSLLTIVLSTGDPDVRLGNVIAVAVFSDTIDCMCIARIVTGGCKEMILDTAMHCIKLLLGA